MTTSMRFGSMLFPLHPLGQSPTVALERDLELIEWMDRWNYDEVWVGEHHSGGMEPVGSPEIFLATAAERTKHIRLGTGVLSLPYHHPFMVAERMVLLDHLTRGRVALGVGPGQLATDAQMLGINPGDQRRMMRESIEVILELLAGKTVTAKTDWFTLDEARLQMRPYSRPMPEVAVAASVSPAGPSLAGKHGLGLLSLASWHPAGFEVLRDHWEVVEEQAALHGKVVDRSNWRMVGPVHIARTEAEARDDVRFGLGRVFDYLGQVVPLPKLTATTFDEIIDQLNEMGGGIIGTPAMAVDMIGRLSEKSGGFGCYMMHGADYAPRHKTLESFQIFAEEVAPHFQGQIEPMAESNQWLRQSPSATPGVTRWVTETTGAIRKEIDEYERARGSQLKA